MMDATKPDSAERRRFIACLLAIMVVGMILRIAYAYDRPFTGDEAGSVEAISLPYSELLTQFGDWRTMNFYLAGLKALVGVFGFHSWILIAPSLLSGVLTIVLSGWIGKRLYSPGTGLIVACLVAVNPFLIRYSATIRSYSLLAALCTGAFLAWLYWRDRPSWRRGSLCAVLLAFGLLAHLNAIYYICSIAVLSFLAVAHWHRSGTIRTAARHAVTLLIPCVIALTGVALAYLPQWPDIILFRGKWSAVPPASVDYVTQVYGMYLGDGWAAPVTFALLAFGVTFTARDGRLLQIAPLLTIVLYVLFMSLAGVSHYAAAFARFSIALLPLLLIVIAVGIVALRRRLLIASSIVAMCVLGMAGLFHLHAMKTASPWHRVAENIIATPDLDAVVGLEGGIARDTNCNASQRIQFTAASELPTVSVGDDGTARVLIVDGQGVLAALRPDGRRVGTVLLVLYTGKSAHDIAEQLLSDLDKALSGDVKGEKIAYYDVGFEIASALGRDDAHTHWRERYWNSYARSPRARNAPSHMTDWPAYR